MSETLEQRVSQNLNNLPPKGNGIVLDKFLSEEPFVVVSKEDVKYWVKPALGL